MAAYAALVSLCNDLELIPNHPTHSFSFDKNQISSLSQIVKFLIDFMETYECTTAAAEALESRITSAAYAAHDVIESHLVDQIHAGSTLVGGRTRSYFLLDLQRAMENMEFVKRKAMQFQAKSGLKAEQPMTELKKRQNNNCSCKVTEPMTELNTKFKGHVSSIESLQLRTQLFDLKAVLMIGVFIIFQAVMYGHVSAKSPSFPPWLSVSASLAFWPALIKAVNDCLRARRQHESCFMEQDKVFRKLTSAQTHAADDAAAQRSLERAFALVHRQRRAYVWVLYLALFLCTLCIPTKSLAPTLGFSSDPD